MNRKGKIIVSVVGIFIVLLALVGITYGYFLTRIQGNTNTKSISVTTADLALVYDGDNGSIIGDNEVIKPDKTFTTKTFTVENKGNTTINAYAVILEDVSITDATSGKAVALNSTRDGKENDFDLVITCNDGDCNGYSDVLPEENAILVTNSIEPGEIHTYSATLKYVETNDDQSADMNKKITGKFNIIDTKDTANLSGKVSNMGDSKYYVQTNSTKRVSYIDSNGNYNILGLEAGPHKLKLCNSTDTTCSYPVMKKDITIKTGTTAGANAAAGEITVSREYKNATININASTGSTEIKENIEFNNPYSKGTLAYYILENGALITDSTTSTNVLDKTIKINPDLNVLANGSSNVNGTFTNDGLFQLEDDYTETTGQDSYYYRGPIKNNYLNFNGYCWRIVRIEGDGSVKIILASESGKCETAGSLTDTSAFLKADGTTGTYDLNLGFYYMQFFNAEDNRAAAIPDLLNNYLRGKAYGGALAQSGYSVTMKKYNSFMDKLDFLKAKNSCIGDNTVKYDSQGNIITNTTGLTSWYYDKYLKLYNKLGTGVEASLKCYSNNYGIYPGTPESYVTLLSGDEVILAGAKAKTSSYNYFLRDNANGNWWLSTYSKHDSAYEMADSSGYEFSFIVKGDGSLYNYGYKNHNKVRPVLKLKPNVTVSAALGTETNPFNVD